MKNLPIIAFLGAFISGNFWIWGDFCLAKILCVIFVFLHVAAVAHGEKKGDYKEEDC